MAKNTEVQTIAALVVEDDVADRRLIKLLLSQSMGHVQFSVEMAETLREATSLLSTGYYGVILLDLGLPDSQGLDALRVLRRANPRIPIVVLTGLSDEETGLEAIKEGAEDYLMKGQSLRHALARTVRYAVERKRAEAEQMTLLAQLENANRELWDFVHTVSHDLKRPLSLLKTLADYLATDYGDEVDENGRMQFDQLRGRVTRMNDLINEVLCSSRIGQPRQETGQVDMHELVHEVIGLLAPPESVAITVCDGLPVVKGELTRIAQVLQNVLSSAIKRVDGSHGRIEVTCEELDGFWRFGILDDGHEPERARPGSVSQPPAAPAMQDGMEDAGIRLLLVKRIVESYGGEIRIESEVGEGSSFFFTLPKLQVEVNRATVETHIAR
ncbi:MAG: response regulator [Sedimentisphaerales bacterium]|nr:response regulator [Sedimentisphaerales bacterium]